MTSTPPAVAPAGGNARLVGHALAVLVGLLALVAGIAGVAKGLPGAMSITLVVIGTVMIAMTRYSLRGSRAAWSLLVAIFSVLAIVTLFGAPTIHKQVHIGLGLALILPVIQVIGAVCLALIAQTYRDD